MLGFGPIGDGPIGSISQPEIYYAILQDAAQLHTSKFHSASVVIAHAACEVCVARALTKVLTNRVSAEFADAAIGLMNGTNLANNRIREFFAEATGLTDLVDQAFWQEFTRSAARRNNVAHRGAEVAAADALATFDACRDLVDHLVTRLGLPSDSWH